MARAVQQSGSARPRLSMILRVLAGTAGAYGVTALMTAALARLLAWMGMDRVEAVIASTLASFAIFAVAAMATFHARTLVRAWSWLALFAAGSGLVLILLTLPKGQ